jgi:hypothetical protein
MTESLEGSRGSRRGFGLAAPVLGEGGRGLNETVKVKQEEGMADGKLRMLTVLTVDVPELCRPRAPRTLILLNLLALLPDGRLGCVLIAFPRGVMLLSA